MKLYEKMRNGENLSWCRPYVSPDGLIWVIYKEGEVDVITEVIKSPYYVHDFVLPNIAIIRGFARKYNAMFDDLFYNYNYTPKDILIGALDEKGCADCPFRDECEAMEDSGENNERV